MDPLQSLSRWLCERKLCSCPSIALKSSMVGRAVTYPFSFSLPVKKAKFDGPQGKTPPLHQTWCDPWFSQIAS